ncbi:hypothetical protein COR50_20890 [Chitinophaga caeni]|uniref:Antitoxin SocA-like Panacea domain-containing protein n=1 Tax=Chitinophaga caeni TaxID=2029983 RepID=A0A291R013_9BACT|nr:type II toxin-antitoxin system antitoxin SocA domain-containing protein [Chitinophaga caeni]ATL49434.1 hypothetical protein COR50_20890 [Chitinophaga caeni]
MVYPSRAIANYFIRESLRSGVELTPMKLIKLCYIAHGWRLGLYHQELINEGVQAWKYGPVVESIYDDFRHYGTHQITALKANDSYDQDYPMPGEDVLPLLKKVWEVYNKYSGLQLSAMTHQDGTPWDLVWNREGGKDRHAAIIPNNLIQQHYQHKIRDTQFNHGNDSSKPYPNNS